MSEHSADPVRRYKLRGTMSFRGAPVDWNARAVIWTGSDWREPVRHFVGRLSGLLRVGHARGWRYRLHLWLFRCVDDRDRTYKGRGVLLARRLLNTEADVDARDAWSLANRYWRANERQSA